MESQLTYICSQDVKEEIKQNAKKEKKERYSLVKEVIELANLLFKCSCLEKNKEERLMLGYRDTESLPSLPKEIHDLWKRKNMFDAFQELFNNKFGSKIKGLDEEHDKAYDEGYSWDLGTVTTAPQEQKEIVRGFITECANNEKFDQFYMDLYEIQKIAQEDRVFEKEKGTAFKRFWFNFQYLMAQVRHMRIMTRLKNNGLDKLTLDKISEVLNPGNMKITRFGTYVRGLTADMANELFKVGYRVIPRDNEPAKEEVIITKIEEEDKFDTTYHKDFVKEMLGISEKEESKMETNKSNFEENNESEKQEKEDENFENEFKKMLADIAHDETIPF